MADEVFNATRNIVNQLGDLWQVPATVRQDTNDKADQFVSAEIRSVVALELSVIIEILGGRRGQLEQEGICPNCRHPLRWHEVQFFDQLEAMHELFVCKIDCDCRLERSY